MIIRLAAAGVALFGALGGLYSGVAAGLTDDSQAGAAIGEVGPFGVDLMAAPLIVDDRVAGYVVGRYVLKLNLSRADRLQTPVYEIVVHGINDFLYRNAAETFWVGGGLTVPDIVEGLTASINAQAGHELVVAIVVRQLDFLQADDIR